MKYNLRARKQERLEAPMFGLGKKLRAKELAEIAAVGRAAGRESDAAKVPPGPEAPIEEKIFWTISNKDEPHRRMEREMRESLHFHIKRAQEEPSV